MLSGSTGYTILRNTNINKSVYLLADIHDGVRYCKQKSDMIDDWLDKKSRDAENIVLLEEAVRETLDLKDLWPGSEHTGRLKKLIVHNQKIVPVDIRPLLISYSWELLSNKDDVKPELQLLTLNDYLMSIDSIFNYKGSPVMKKYIVPEMLKLNLNRRPDDEIRSNILMHFNEMKEVYIKYRHTCKSYLDKPMIKLYSSREAMLEQINDMTTMIMEWYILLLIFNNNNERIIIHVGLAHSNRILDLLREVHDFQLVKQVGINEISQILGKDDNEELNACIEEPQ